MFEFKTNEELKKQYKKLNERDPRVFQIREGDEIRLENKIYTTIDDGEVLGFEDDPYFEDHQSDLPFEAEIYPQGNHDLKDSERIFVKQYDVVSFDRPYVVLRSGLNDDSIDLSLIPEDVILEAPKFLDKTKDANSTSVTTTKAVNA